ncbi:hypothetical protein SKPI104516_15450 [Skermania piniformis]
MVADFPDGSNFRDNPPDHPNTDLWRDIPMSGEWITIRDKKGRKRRFWKATARGAITLPATASRLAEHAELVGYVLDPKLAKIKRQDPVRLGRSLTSPGDWVDLSAPDPAPNPVLEHAAAAEAELTPVELRELRDRIDQQLEGHA